MVYGRKYDFMDAMISNGYGSLLVEIKECIRKAQYKALREVNKELIRLYWDIGKILWNAGIVTLGERLWWKGLHGICRKNFQA